MTHLKLFRFLSARSTSFCPWVLLLAGALVLALSAFSLQNLPPLVGMARRTLFSWQSFLVVMVRQSISFAKNQLALQQPCFKVSFTLTLACKYWWSISLQSLGHPHLYLGCSTEAEMLFLHSDFSWLLRLLLLSMVSLANFKWETLRFKSEWCLVALEAIGWLLETLNYSGLLHYLLEAGHLLLSTF